MQFYEKILAYNIYKHATSINFDTNYVFVSYVVLSYVNFEFWGGARNFGGYLQGVELF